MMIDDLVSSVQSAIGILSASYRIPADESDLYEAALFCVAVEAAVGAGGSCMMTNDGVTATRQITFRRSPGNLGVGGARYSYARIAFAGSAKVIEVHLGIKVVGLSGVSHECDIAIIDSLEAERSRNLGVDPRRQGLIGAIEAKNYSAAPGLAIGRAFLGLSTELTPSKSNLVYPSRSSASVRVLLAKKASECFDGVTPSSESAQRLAHLLEQKIRNWIA